jgi:hypothetical protein
VSATCPNCRSVVPPGDVQPDKHLARCAKCKQPFALPLLPLDPAAPPPVPAGVEVTDDGVTRKLAFRWFRPRTLLMVLVCVAMDAFLIWWYWTALARWPAVSWPGTLIPLVHVAAGVVLKYRTLCELVNRTAVEVGDVLRVQHGPLFWPGAEVPATDVTAVVCVPVLHQNKGSAWVKFSVQAETESGPSVTLLTGLDTLSRAQFFEWKLEEWLELSPTEAPREAV